MYRYEGNRYDFISDPMAPTILANSLGFESKTAEGGCVVDRGRRAIIARTEDRQMAQIIADLLNEKENEQS